MEGDSSNSPNSPFYPILYDQAADGPSTSAAGPPTPVSPAGASPLESPFDEEQQNFFRFNMSTNYPTSRNPEIPSSSTSGSASPAFFPQSSGHHAIFSSSEADCQQNMQNTYPISHTQEIPGPSTSVGASPEPSLQASGYQTFDNQCYSQETANSTFTSLLQASSSLSIGQQMLLSSSSTSSQQTPSSTESTSRSLEVPVSYTLKSASPRHSFRRSKQQTSSSTLNQQTPSPVRPAPYTSVSPGRASPDGRRQMPPPELSIVVRRRVASGSTQRREGDRNRNEPDLETVINCYHPNKARATYCDCCKKFLCQECSTKVTRHRPKIEFYQTLEYLKKDVVSRSVSAVSKIQSDINILKRKRQKTTDHLNIVKKTSQLLTSYEEDLELLDHLFEQAIFKGHEYLSHINEVSKMSEDEGNYSRLNSIRRQITNLHLKKAVKKSFLDDRNPSRNLCDVLDVLENEEETEEADTQVNRFVRLLQENYPIYNYDPTSVAGPSTLSGFSSNSPTSSVGAASLAYQAGPSFSAVSGASAFSRSAGAGLNRDWVTAEGKWIVNSDNSYQGALEALKNEERPKQILVVVPPGDVHSENLLRNLLNSLKTVRCELKLRCLDSFYQGRDTDVDKERLTVLFGPGWTEIIDGPRLTEFVGYLQVKDVTKLPCTLETIGQHFKTANDASLFYKRTTSLTDTFRGIKIHALLPLEGLRDPVCIQIEKEIMLLDYPFVVHVPYVTVDNTDTVVKNYEMKGHFLSWPGVLFLPECRLTDVGAVGLARALGNVEDLYTGPPQQIYFTSDPSYTHHQQGVKAALERIDETNKVGIVEEGMCAVWDLPINDTVRHTA